MLPQLCLLFFECDLTNQTYNIDCAIVSNMTSVTYEK